MVVRRGSLHGIVLVLTCTVNDVTDVSPTTEEPADESNWTPIADDDEVWSPPTELPTALADPRPSLLNTHEMGWEPFERLVLGMARTLDGAYAVHRYGKPGQAQHGLDVVAFLHGRAPSVYQAKHWQEFGAADLEDAVERYVQPKRPFDADRIVVAVATEARDTATIEKLAELNNRHTDMTIELWDRQEISDRLRPQLRLVTTFFGEATAAAFCVPTPPPTLPPPQPSIAADAILRGPIAHLQLVDELAQAEQAMGKNPQEAAVGFAHIASRLEGEGFVPHAVPVREFQARALRAAGDRENEAWVRVGLGWRQLAAGDEFSAVAQAREIAEWGDDAPDVVVRCTNALAAAARFRHEHTVTLEHLTESFDELLPDDPHRADAALVLAEEAMAARRYDLVEPRAHLLRELANAMPNDNENQLVAARLLMAVADCAGGWNELAETARDVYPPRIAALVTARYARYLALIPEPAQAVGRWRDAIERACLEGLNDDAADWLYAVRTVRVQTGFNLLDGDINEPHRHALALRAAGNGTILPEPYRARERALANLRDEKWPNALEALRRYLWRSAVGADWTGEMDAHKLLGDLFLRTGRPRAAVEHYVVAGESKKLEALASGLRDEPVRLPIQLVTPRPWERAAAFSFAAAAADLIVDEDAVQWCKTAFHEIVEHPQPASPGAPDAWLAAFKAFGKLGIVSTEEQARRFLDEISHELIPRESNRYRFTDEAHIEALIGIAHAHPGLRDEAIDHLLRALLTDQRMAEVVLSRGGDLLRGDPQRTVAAVADAAATGNDYAGLALIAAEGDTTQAAPLARQRLETAIAPRVHEPGVHTFGTWLPQSAALITALDEDERVTFSRGMVEFASDEKETAYDRIEALIALRVIARSLPDDVRDELFERSVRFAQGGFDTSSGEELFPSDDDPLARFRIRFGQMSLAPDGLKASAALARTEEQYGKVERIAVAQLRGADENTANSVAAAVASIPPGRVTLPVDVLATHPSEWMRALAAIIWAQRPDLPDEIGVQLARDPSRHVRRSLASSLRNEVRHAPCKEILCGDPRRSLRRQVSGMKETTEPTV